MLIENLSRNISNYFLLCEFSRAHLARAYANLHFKALHCVRAGRKQWQLREKNRENRQRTTFSIFYPLVKLNGNYFPLTIQHRRKLIMVFFCCNKMLVIFLCCFLPPSESHRKNGFRYVCKTRTSTESRTSLR